MATEHIFVTNNSGYIGIDGSPSGPHGPGCTCARQPETVTNSEDDATDSIHQPEINMPETIEIDYAELAAPGLNRDPRRQRPRRRERSVAGIDG